MTQTVREKMRDNPNAQLHHMHTEVGMLNRKIEPLLQRVEQATAMVKSAGHHQSLSSQPGPVGMLSRMGGRLISFYADDLADLAHVQVVVPAARPPSEDDHVALG